MENTTNYDLLVEFEFVVDLDLAMYKYLRVNYANSSLLDPKLFSLNDEREVIFNLLNRKHINPLEIFIPGQETTELYHDLMDNHMEELLEYATVYDTFKLMITYLNNISSPISITVLCKNQLEADYIKKCNDRLNIKIKKDKHSINLNRFTSIYVKYLSQLIEYNRAGLNGKHLYFAAAKFNMEENEDRVKGTLSYMFSDTNILHMMDLYTKVKYRFSRKDGEQ